MQPFQKYVFILRLWRVNQPAAASWQASIEIPNTRKRIGFGNLEQLFAFLMDLSDRKGDKELVTGEGLFDFPDLPHE